MMGTILEGSLERHIVGSYLWLQTCTKSNRDSLVRMGGGGGGGKKT
jgi:hypothetical protein